jgi:GT2 family glycosyltransferase/SAM-dependent methyltransferase
MTKVAIIYDHLTRPETTGCYCLRALAERAHVEQFHPSQLKELRRSEYDLYLFVDDGFAYPLPNDLRPQAYWAIDTHIDFVRERERAAGTDFIFAAQRNGAELLSQALGRSVEWLPLACDPAIHARHDVPTSFNISFVGNLIGRERNRLVQLLKSKFPDVYIGRHFFEDMAAVYSASRLVFNRSVVDDINMRVFEGLCSGSLLVTNDLSENGQAGLFQDGKHLVTYRGDEELLDKIRFYLKHHASRERIARAGRQEVLDKHTYRHRVERVLHSLSATSVVAASWPKFGNGSRPFTVVRAEGDVRPGVDAGSTERGNYFAVEPGCGDAAAQLRREDHTGQGTRHECRAYDLKKGHECPSSAIAICPSTTVMPKPLGTESISAPANGPPLQETGRLGPDPHYFEFARPEILALIPNDARTILDIGCGAGQLGRALKARQDCNVYGVELNETAASRARAYLDRVWTGDIELIELDLPDESLDAIVCGDVLEHLREPRDVLRRLSGYLKPNGRLIASIPNAAHHSVIRGLLAGNWNYEPAGLLDETHLRFFTVREIEKLFFRAGFRIERMDVVRGPGDEPLLPNTSTGPIGLGNFTVGGLSPESIDGLTGYQYLVTAVPAPPRLRNMNKAPSLDLSRHGGPSTQRERWLTSIVMLTSNQLDYTRLCLASIRSRTDEPYEVIVVDNGSTDGTVEYLRNMEGVRLIANAENRGFPAAVNQGIRVARGDYILLLNNDCIVTTGWLSRLLDAVNCAPEVGLAGPCSNRVSGEQQIPAGYDQLSDLDGFAWEWTKSHAGQRVATDRLVAFCLLIKRSVIDRVGLLDERFGLGNFEDDDFCRRALDAGFKLVVAKDAFVHHFGSITYRAMGINFESLLRHNNRLFQEKWSTESAARIAVPACASEPCTCRSTRFELTTGEGPGLRLRAVRPRVSLCMIVRDSARTLGPCLASVRPWVDEMIVVDTGSQDSTPAIAEKYGARVFYFPWCDDFSAARNESLSHATGEWLFWMDSDDTIDEVNGRKLRELVDGPHPPELMAYVMQVHCPHEQDERDCTAVDHVKLFRNLPELRFEGRIHEQILPAINRLGGQVAWTDIFVVHSGSDQTPEGQEKKLARDVRILKLEEQERPNHPFVLFNLGMTYLEMKWYDEAVKYLTRTIDVAKPHESHVPKAFSLLVQALSSSRQWNEAARRCDLGVQRYPDDPELAFRAGVLAQHFGRATDAEAYYLKVLNGQWEPRFRSIDRGILGYKSRQNLACLYSDTERHAEAEHQWRMILTDRPDYEPARRGLVSALLKQGKVVEAQAAIADSRETPREPATSCTSLLVSGPSRNRACREVLLPS